MNRIIGFDRKIQLDWLDATVGLCQEDLDFDIMAERLHRQLENKVAGPESRRKTITVLLRLWAKVPTTDQPLRGEALQMAAQVSPEERFWLHWGMSMLAYPFFRDVAATVGQLSRLQGSFSHAQVQRRMMENWGQRTTLQRAVQRLLRTFVDWGVLRDTDTRGSYEVAPPRQIENRALALWFLDCALRAHEAEVVSLRELERLSYTFPFDLLPFVNDLRRSDRFEFTRQGLDLEMVSPIEV